MKWGFARHGPRVSQANAGAGQRVDRCPRAGAHHSNARHRSTGVGKPKNFRTAWSSGIIITRITSA